MGVGASDIRCLRHAKAIVVEQRKIDVRDLIFRDPGVLSGEHRGR